MNESLLVARRLASMTPRERARIGPRTLKDTHTLECAWQTTEYLKTLYGMKEASLDRWETALAEAEQHRIYERIPLEKPYGTMSALLRAEIGETRVSIALDPTSVARTVRRHFDAAQIAALMEALSSVDEVES